jgi:hypothetical protein
MLMVDYASFLLEAKKLLKDYEDAMIQRRFSAAAEIALDAVAEVRLLAQVAKDKRDAG